MSERMPCHPLVIIGAGPAGMSAALWAKRLGVTPVVFERHDVSGGQLATIEQPIDDYLGLFADDGRALQRRFVEHLERSGIAVRTNVSIERIERPAHAVRGHVPTHKTETAEGAETAQDCWRLHGAYTGDQTRRPGPNDATVYRARAVIVATGVRPRRLGIPGEALIADTAFASTSRGPERFRGRHVAIVGGGDRAVEGALNIAPHAAQVWLLVRSSALRARKALRERLNDYPNVTMLRETTLERIDRARIDRKRINPGRTGTADGRFVLTLGRRKADSPHLPTAPNPLIVDDVLLRIGMEPALPDMEPPIEQTAEGLWIAGDAALPPSERSIAAAVGCGMRAAKRAVLWLEEQDKIGSLMKEH
ncbi:MAG: NAD(P)/FAD-dependent oxidoreductase [Hydrogenibacillus sp.]|nr:NAD(P)/FAD-dependent oxidoreductase [Hydrogenibacillus sp.]